MFRGDLEIERENDFRKGWFSDTFPRYPIETWFAAGSKSQTERRSSSCAPALISNAQDRP